MSLNVRVKDVVPASFVKKLSPDGDYHDQWKTFVSTEPVCPISDTQKKKAFFLEHTREYISCKRAIIPSTLLDIEVKHHIFIQPVTTKDLLYILKTVSFDERDHVDVMLHSGNDDPIILRFKPVCSLIPQETLDKCVKYIEQIISFSSYYDFEINDIHVLDKMFESPLKMHTVSTEDKTEDYVKLPGGDGDEYLVLKNTDPDEIKDNTHIIKAKDIDELIKTEMDQNANPLYGVMSITKCPTQDIDENTIFNLDQIHPLFSLLYKPRDIRRSLLKQLEQCLLKDPYVLVGLSIHLPPKEHANYLLIDKTKKKIIRIEPHYTVVTNWEEKYIDMIIEKNLKYYLNDYKYVRKRANRSDAPEVLHIYDKESMSYKRTVKMKRERTDSLAPDIMTLNKYIELYTLEVIRPSEQVTSIPVKELFGEHIQGLMQSDLLYYLLTPSEILYKILDLWILLNNEVELKKMISKYVDRNQRRGAGRRARRRLRRKVNQEFERVNQEFERVKEMLEPHLFSDHETYLCVYDNIQGKDPFCAVWSIYIAILLALNPNIKKLDLQMYIHNVTRDDNLKTIPCVDEKYKRLLIFMFYIYRKFIKEDIVIDDSKKVEGGTFKFLHCTTASKRLVYNNLGAGGKMRAVARHLRSLKRICRNGSIEQRRHYNHILRKFRRVQASLRS